MWIYSKQKNEIKRSHDTNKRIQSEVLHEKNDFFEFDWI